MKLDKKQLEVIAYSLALLESELPKEARSEAHYIISALQKKGIFGIIND